MLWTLAFWKGASERAIKTFAQTLVALIGTDALGLLDVDWEATLWAAALATLLSVLTSIGNADFTAGEPVVAKHRDLDGDGIADGVVHYAGEHVAPKDEPDSGKTGRGGYMTGQ